MIRNPADPFYSVIPGRAEGAGPESITPVLREETSVIFLQLLWLWIPGSPLRGAPE